MNPIELLWDELGRRVRKVFSNSITLLWNILQEQSNNMPNTALKKRMSKLVKNIIPLLSLNILSLRDQFANAKFKNPDFLLKLNRKLVKLCK